MEPPQPVSVRPPSVDDFEAQRWKAEVRKRLLGKTSEASRLGRYELREQIGRGGMGLVYRAHDPQLDRPVAIKVLRRLDDAVTDRLKAEARTLAELDHPNIVAIYDVGTSQGRTFIVMPLLSGTTLDVWSRQADGDEQRVEVLRQVAAALQTAHGAGILHRDIKPSNVIVDASGHAFVVDFGLNRRAPSTSSGDGSPSTRSTAAGGTAGYVAPEQARGASVDARTDVYAFCVTAIECLTGRAPAPARDAACSEDELDILLVDVPGRWRTGLRKGVRHDPEQRLRSIQDVIGVLQRPPRRSAGWIAGTAIAGVLGVALLSNATSQTEAVPVEATPAQPASAPEVRAMLDEAQQQIAEEDLATAEATLEQAFRAAIAARDADAEVAAALAMGKVLIKQRRARDAARWLRHIKAALARASRTDATVDVELLASRVARADGDLEAARAHADAAVASLGPDSAPNQRAEAIGDVGRLELLQGDSKAAVRTLERAIAIAREAKLSPTIEGALLSDLGASHLRHGDVDAARPALELSVQRLQSALHPDHSRLAMAAQNLAIVQWRGGDLDGAIVSFRQGVTAFEAALGPEHPEVAHALENLGTGLIYAQDHDAALEAFNRALVIREATSGTEHPDIARTLSYIAQAHEGAAHWPEAARFAERAHTMALSTLGRLHPSTAEALAARSRIEAARGDLPAARTFAEETLAIYTQIGAGPLEHGAALASLAYALCGVKACAPNSPTKTRATKLARKADALFTEAGDVAATSRTALHGWAAPLLEPNG